LYSVFILYTVPYRKSLVFFGHPNVYEPWRKKWEAQFKKKETPHKRDLLTQETKANPTFAI